MVSCGSMLTTHMKIWLGILGFFVLAVGAAAAYLAYGIKTAPITSDDNFLEFASTSVSSETSSTTPEGLLAGTTTATSTATTTTTKTGYKSAIATVFWVGEEADASNDFIPNAMSAWDEQWMEHYGGIDDPDCRSGYNPCRFVAKENPFYVALPYNDLDEEGDRKDNAALVHWYSGKALSLSAGKSILKNHWIEVTRKNKTCYGQWQDVGPFEEDDVAYVFGTNMKSKNTFDAGAGIDLSPAMRDCLGVGDISDVEWRFVEDTAVPKGPWTKVVTTRR